METGLIHLKLVGGRGWSPGRIGGGRVTVGRREKSGKRQPRPQGAFPWPPKAREKRPGDEVGEAGVKCKTLLVVALG